MNEAANRKAELERRAAALRQQAKLQSLTRSVRTIQDDKVDNEQEQAELFTRVIRDGLADQIRAAIVETHREIEQHRKLGRLSNASEQTAVEYEREAEKFLGLKVQLEKTEKEIELIREKQKAEPDPILLSRASSLREECIERGEIVLKLFKRFDHQVTQDRKTSESLLETFSQCLSHLPPAERGKLDVQIRQKIQNVDIQTRIKILNAIIFRLASAVPSIAENQVQALYESAREAFQAKRYKTALSQLDQLFKFNRFHIKAHRLRAKIYNRIGNAIAFKMELRMIVEIPDAEAFDYYALAESLESSNLEEAFTYFQKTVEKDPRIKYIERWGDAAMRLRRWQAAVQAFTRIVKQKPHRAETLHKLGICLFESNLDEDRAFEVLRAGIRQKDDSAASQVALGRIYRNRKMHEPARKAFTRAIELDESNPDAPYWLAMLDYDEGEYLEAQAYARIACEIEPARPRNLILMAKCAAAMGETGRAVQVLEDWLASRDPALDVLLTYSDMCRRLRTPQKAIEAFEPVVKRFPRHPQLRSEYGLLLLDSGRFKEAASFMNPAAVIRA
ncbi:MAG: tetratricopeptide repeat protein [bacterium]|nr:tetratricopeptide repeat protein [bacterium]